MKSIAITGPSGVGKTYVLKQFFGISGGYGALSVCGLKREPIRKGQLQFIPELKRVAKFREADNAKIENGYRKLLQLQFTSCIDVGPYVSYTVPYAKELTDCLVVSIDATQDQILNNLLNRRLQDNGRDTKLRTAELSFKALKRYHEKADMVLKQDELMKYLTRIV